MTTNRRSQKARRTTDRSRSLQRMVRRLMFGLVLVEWIDSAYSLGWLTEADTEEPKLKRCCSVGWLRKETQDSVTLTANLTMEENPHRCCEITIPKRAVQRMHRL